MKYKCKLFVILLALFPLTGGIGLHKLYLDQPMLFKFSLAFSLAGISYMVAIHDAIKFMFMPVHVFNQKYNGRKII
jgi:TM2 domain-containing membrane protein YozV